MDSLFINARQTHGERMVASFLNRLPGQYYYPVAEPAIQSRSGTRRPDFVVVARYLGVAIIEVKDWKEIIQASQSEFRIRRTDGTVQTVPNPERTTLEYARDLASQFQKHEELLGLHQGRTKLVFPWQEVVVLTHIGRNLLAEMEAHHVITPGITLCREDLADLESFEGALTRLPWRFRLKEPLGDIPLRVIRSVIDPEIIIRSPQGDLVGVETIQQQLLIRATPSALDLHQELSDDAPLPGEVQKLVRDPSVRLVRGVAGAGKTLVLVRRARFLKKHFPNQQILVLTFNVDLAADLRQRIDSPEITVTTFHKLCAQVLGADWRSPIEVSGWLKAYVEDLVERHGLSLDFVADEIKWRKETELFDNEQYLNALRTGRGTKLARTKREIVNQVFDQYLEFQTARNMNGRRFFDWEDVPHIVFDLLSDYRHPIRHSFDFVLIDEAQDFAPSWIKVIKLLLKPRGSMLVCDDPTQSLFKYFSWKEKGLNVVGRTSILPVPFRCTREIMLAAFSLWIT
jgi:hypothetical protein